MDEQSISESNTNDGELEVLSTSNSDLTSSESSDLIEIENENESSNKESSTEIPAETSIEVKYDLPDSIKEYYKSRNTSDDKIEVISKTLQLYAEKKLASGEMNKEQMDAEIKAYIETAAVQEEQLNVFEEASKKYNSYVEKYGDKLDKVKNCIDSVLGSGSFDKIRKVDPDICIKLNNQFTKKAPMMKGNNFLELNRPEIDPSLIGSTLKVKDFFKRYGTEK